MQWAISKSVEEIGEKGRSELKLADFVGYGEAEFISHNIPVGEKLKHKRLQGYGNKTMIDGEEYTVGAGGRYGGVHLAMSDQKTQENNMAMLKAMFEREKKKRRKEKKSEEEKMEQQS